MSSDPMDEIEAKIAQFRFHMKNAAKTVFGVFIGLQLALVCVSLLTLAIFIFKDFIHRDDPFCAKQTFDILECKNGSFLEDFDKNGLGKFAAVFENPYNSRISTDLYTFHHSPRNDEQILLRGTDIIWNGWYDLKEGQEAPAILRFMRKLESGNQPRCEHVYQMKCSELDSMLEEYRKKWNGETFSRKLKEFAPAFVLMCIVNVSISIVAKLLDFMFCRV